MSYYPNEVYSFFSFLSFLFFIIPSLCAWRLEAWNTALFCDSIWGAIGSLNFFINSIVWKGRLDNFAPVWCDISSRIQVAMDVAFHACSLSINRRLYHITKGNVAVTCAEKWRAIAIDLAICVGIPSLDMILYYIHQGHRFNLYEDFGCYAPIYVTWVEFVLYEVWPLVIVSVSSVYCVLNLIAFNKYRKQFQEHLSQINDLNPSFYFRLMCLTSTDIVVTIPLTIWVIVTTVKGGIYPWISWEDTHYNFSRVDFVPALVWKSDGRMRVGLEFTRWSVFICAIVCFGFFGFTTEARKTYHAAFCYIWRCFGYRSSNEAEEPEHVLEFALPQSQNSIPQTSTVTSVLNNVV